MTSAYSELSWPHIIQAEIPACRTKCGYFPAERKTRSKFWTGLHRATGRFYKRPGTRESLYKETWEVKSLQYCHRVTPSETLLPPQILSITMLERAPVTVWISTINFNSSCTGLSSSSSHQPLKNRKKLLYYFKNTD